MKRIIIFLMPAVMILTACKDDKVTVNASFTTDKDVYNLTDAVIITNTSTVKNSYIVLNKWEFLGTENYKAVPVPEDIYFEEPGEYLIKLTVYTENSLQATFEKTITVVDNNIPPVADFSWSPTEIKSGEPVQFTDRSTDADGHIVAWEWKFGTTVIHEQNPLFTFAGRGEIVVSLTVTDNGRGKDTKTVTVHVEGDENSFELLWEDSYDTSDAWVWYSSPAVSNDGAYIYVFSAGYHLVAYTKEGEKLWNLDLNLGGVTATGGRNGTLPSKRNPGTTPSVDPADGTIFIGVGHNNVSSTRPNGYLYAVKGGEEGGTIKWTCAPLQQTIQRFYAPVVTEDYVIIGHGGRANAPPAPITNGEANSHLEVYTKADGVQIFGGHVNTGCSGGILALKSGRMVASTAGADPGAGVRLFIPNGTGLWHNASASSNNNNNLGNSGLTARSSQPAAGPNGKIYLLGRTGNATFVSGTPLGTAVVVFYDNVNAHEQGVSTPYPYTWAVPVKGNFPEPLPASEGQLSGMGVAVGEDGVVYAATCKLRGSANSAWITAINPNGTKKWEHEADGNIQGVPAIDNYGNVYYFDWEISKLVMLNRDTGDRLAESQQLGDTFTLAADLIGGGSSPTIAPDGTIYINAIKEGRPTIFAIRGMATGMSDSWSQLGGNHSKTGYVY